MKPDSWRHGVTRYQWLVLFVAWLGWVFDSMDSTIYALVLQPALHDLMRSPGGGPVTTDVIGWYGGIIFSIFLIGWAIGGVVFGVLADRFRADQDAGFHHPDLRACSPAWPRCRKPGGNWHCSGSSRRSASVANGRRARRWWPRCGRRTNAPRRRVCCNRLGPEDSWWRRCLSLLLRNYGWRPMFVVGIAPAFVALFVFLWVREPERWVKAHAEEQRTGGTRPSKLAELFAPGLARSTMVGSGLAFVAVFGLWGATNWTPTLIRALPDLQGLSASELTSRVSYATMLLNVGALAGYLSFGPLADRVGRRWVFALMCARQPGDAADHVSDTANLCPRAAPCCRCWAFSTTAFSAASPFTCRNCIRRGFGATGAGFCFNIGRVLASAGPFVTGCLVTVLGSFGRAASAVAAIYIVGLLILPFAPETKGKPLPP